MVRVTFKLTDAETVELHLDEPQHFAAVLKESAEKAGVEIGGVIAVCRGKVISLDEVIDINDSIDVFPAISGG